MGFVLNLSLPLFIRSQAFSVYLCVHRLIFLSLSVSSSHAQNCMVFSLACLFCSSLHTYATLPRRLAALCFSLSFLPSHLVTRPLERSVEFPLSQRRGQSEPHKDPQWTPSALALSSLHSVTLQLHTHSHTALHTVRMHPPTVTGPLLFYTIHLTFSALGSVFIQVCEVVVKGMRPYFL